MSKISNDKLKELGELLDYHPRKVNNVHPEWYIKVCGTFCSQCRLAYDFIDSWKLLKYGRAKGQIRGPRCNRCGKILRTRSKPNPKSGFWDKVEELEGIKHIQCGEEE
jgi:hypothetical protein